MLLYYSIKNQIKKDMFMNASNPGYTADGEKKNIFYYLSRILPIAMMLTLTVLAVIYRHELSFKAIVNFSPSNPWLAALFLIALFALKSLSVSFPQDILFYASGIMFPMPIAILVNLAGLAVNLTIPYYIGMFSGSDTADRLTRKYKKLDEVKSLRTGNEFFFVFFLRFVGLLSCDVLSMYMGSVKVKYKNFIIAGLLGCLPRLIIKTVVGASASDPKSPTFIISVVLMCSIGVVSCLIYYFYRKRKIKKIRENNSCSSDQITDDADSTQI